MAPRIIYHFELSFSYVNSFTRNIFNHQNVKTSSIVLVSFTFWVSRPLNIFVISKAPPSLFQFDSHKEKVKLSKLTRFFSVTFCNAQTHGKFKCHMNVSNHIHFSSAHSNLKKLNEMIETEKDKTNNSKYCNWNDVFQCIAYT